MAPVRSARRGEETLWHGGRDWTPAAGGAVIISLYVSSTSAVARDMAMCRALLRAPPHYCFVKTTVLIGSDPARCVDRQAAVLRYPETKVRNDAGLSAENTLLGWLHGFLPSSDGDRGSALLLEDGHCGSRKRH